MLFSFPTELSNLCLAFSFKENTGCPRSVSPLPFRTRRISFFSSSFKMSLSSRKRYALSENSTVRPMSFFSPVNDLTIVSSTAIPKELSRISVAMTPRVFS